MSTVTVSPLRQRGEILFLLSSTVAILLIATALIFVKKSAVDGPKRLKGYQISGITTLTGANQSIFTDLYTAALDIEYYHQTNNEKWPDLRQLEKDLIAPFVKDQTWESRGRLSWREQPTGNDDASVHLNAYVGKSSNFKVAGSFLILFEHFHSSDGTYYMVAGRKRPYTIWFRADDFDLPGTISEGTLIQNGWKEVVSFTGKDQRKKLNR